MSEKLEDLRDSFAMAALMGILANTKKQPKSSASSYARFSYEVADAMITERDRKLKSREAIEESL